MKPITLVLPYYCNPGMLRVHQETWHSYPWELKARLHVIVVDDCSPSGSALDAIEDIGGLASFRLYRTSVDVRWNWLFCRNLGAREAVTPWMLLTDVDHVLPAETLRALCEGKHDQRRAYHLSRRNAPDLSEYKHHPDSFFLTRELFWRVGGYDERFSGLYGSSSHFRHRLVAQAGPIELLPAYLIRTPREVIPDAAVPLVVNGKKARKTADDAAGLNRVRAEIASLPGAYRPRTLSFPYERLI